MHTRHDPTSQRKLLPLPAFPVNLNGHSTASDICSAAAVLPEQFHTPSDGIDQRHGVVALMHAVLEEALHCWQQQSTKSGRRAQRLATEAEEWLFTDDSSWPFSFVNLCAALNLAPDYIRRGLRRVRQHSQIAR
jgi:hypothetical protein